MASKSHSRVDPGMLEGAYVARYRKDAVVNYTARGAIASAVLTALLVLTFVESDDWFFKVFVAVVLGGMLIFALFATFSSPAQWGTDDRLALAVRHDGVVVPKVGFIAWPQMSELLVLQNPIARSRAITVALQRWFGVYETKRVIIFVRDLPEVLAGGNEDTLGVALPDANGDPSGITVLFGHGMTNKTFWDAVAALTEQAQAANTIIYEPNPAAFANEHLRRQALALKKKTDAAAQG